MADEDEGGQGVEGGQDVGGAAEPTMQFDLFRARRADERAQQETQAAYTFPPEYAAEPGALFPDLPQGAPPYPPAPPAGRYAGYAAEPGRSGAPRWRAAAIFGGAVVLAAALGFGIWAALGSSGPSTAGAAAGSSATPTSTGKAGGKSGAHAKAETFRVTIESVGANSFSGKLLADGRTVTIALDDKTHYGTKTRPFSRSDLTVGQTVIVHGRRTGTDTVTATVVAANTEASSAAA